MKLIKEDNRGRVYQVEGFKIFYRNIGSVSGGNDKNEKEVIYLISGIAEVTLRDEARKAEAPGQFVFPANTYHKIHALTDIIFIIKE